MLLGSCAHDHGGPIGAAAGGHHTSIVERVGTGAHQFVQNGSVGGGKTERAKTITADDDDMLSGWDSGVGLAAGGKKRSRKNAAKQNPKGIPTQSPGLRGTSYPGKWFRGVCQPRKGCACAARFFKLVRKATQPFQGWIHLLAAYPG